MINIFHPKPLPLSIVPFYKKNPLPVVIYTISVKIGIRIILRSLNMANKNVRKWIVYVMIALMLVSGLGMGLSMM